VSSKRWATAGWCSFFPTFSSIISARPVGWCLRYVGFPAQAYGESFDSADILTIFPLNNGTNSAVTVLICPGSCFFDCPNFMLTRLDIIGDGVLNIDDVGRCVPTPVAGIPQLLLVLLQRLGVPIDCCAS
jgi:hypothetical protein